MRSLFHLFPDGKAAGRPLNLNGMSQNTWNEVHWAAWNTFRTEAASIQADAEPDEPLGEAREKEPAATHKFHNPLPGIWTRRGRAISMEVI